MILDVPSQKKKQTTKQTDKQNGRFSVLSSSKVLHVLASSDITSEKSDTKIIEFDWVVLIL